MATDNNIPDWIVNIRPRPPWIRKLLRWVTYSLGNIVAKIDLKGREYIPKDGPLILVGNHFTIWEPPMMIYAIPEPLNILAAGDLTWEPTQAWATFIYGYIPTNREQLRPSTIREATKALKRGEFVALFPEAGMNEELQLRRGKPGAVYLSAMTNSPILPVGFSGYGNDKKYWKNFHRMPLKIRIGKPFGPFSLSRNPEEKKQQLQDYSDEIMRHVAGLIPSEMRGVYKDDPAVQPYEMYEFQTVNSEQ